MHYKNLQHMIALVEEETRKLGYDYSADFLKIAASSLEREAALLEEHGARDKTGLENYFALQ